MSKYVLKMKTPALKFILTASTAILSGFYALAQVTPEALLRENLDRAACHFHSYEYIPAAETPAPEGYKAFYVNHYGRHGSRRSTNWYAETGYNNIKKAKEAGILTPLGEELYNDVSKIYAEHVDMVGELSERGAREHRAIAERLYWRYPEIFNGERKEVDARASTVQRCIISMAHFTSSLDDCAPALKFDFRTGKKHWRIINHEYYDRKSISKYCEQVKDSVIRAMMDPTRFMNSIIKADPDGVVGDPYAFMESIFTTGAISQCLDYPADVLGKYFTFDEVLAEYCSYNSRMYADMSNSLEFGDNVIWAPAQGLAQDFIERGDAAISRDSKRAADLRFGHDTGILPFAGLLGLEGVSLRRRSGDISDYWSSSMMIPMATNLQMVYFRNDKDDILVKIYYNERETKIDGLDAVTGPYYRWDDLKAWINSRIDEVNARINNR